MTLEKSLEDRCVEYARAHGCFAKKHGQDGWPDQQFFWGNGRHFWVEFKTPAGHYRALQKVIGKMLQRWGDRVYGGPDFNFEHFVSVIETYESIFGPATAIQPP